MAVYRANFLQPETIAMVPVQGYAAKTNYSADGIRWLDFIAASEEIEIKHALNGRGEVKIGDMYVDGYCESRNTIYQYHVSFLICFIFN